MSSSLLLLVLSFPAAAISPEAQELIAYDKQLAAEKCRFVRDYIELTIAAGFGNAARAQEIEKRSRAPRSPEREATAKRRNEINASNKLTPEDQRAMSEARGRLEASCPYEKEGVPLQLPPAQDEAAARDMVLAFVPRALAKMRQCEVFYPERRGSLERAWSASVFSKLDMPELKASVEDVRAWMKEGFGTPAAGSRMERDLKDPEKNRMQATLCDMRDLQRIEAAIPAAFLAKYRRQG